MSVFASHQLPDLRGKRTRKHDARRFDGLPTCARAYQIINALAVVLHADGHDELLVLRQTQHRTGFRPCRRQKWLNRVCYKPRPPSSFAANLAQHPVEDDWIDIVHNMKRHRANRHFGDKRRTAAHAISGRQPQEERLAVKP
jgi:hypothetical protein